MDRPETRYAKTVDGVHIAYQVVGKGPVDLVYVPGFASHLEYAWRDEGVASFRRALATKTRLILIDRRGTGMSDRVPEGELPTIEVRIDDVRAVLDAIGSPRAALFGEFDSGAMAAVFAAAHPSRCAAIVLMTPDICSTWAPDFPWAWTSQQWDEEYRWVERAWGTEEYVRERVGAWAPSLAGEPESARRYADLLRNAASPGAALSITRMEAETDIRRILPTIQVPTLVIRRRDDLFFSPDEIRFVAAMIPGALYSEVPGTDSLPWVGEQSPIVTAVAGFLASVRGEEAQFDRVLATVLFIDIVGSTERAAQLGDRLWKDLLERYHQIARAMLGRYRGREVDMVGDGLFATFDGPARAVRCAQAIGDAVRSLGLEIRSGCHTGEVELSGEDLRGIGVHIGARVAALAGPNEVLVSSTVKDLVAGSGLAFEDRGMRTLKGISDHWHLYAVSRGDSSS